MDYFITLNEKSIDAIGEAVEKPITVIEGLKSTIVEQAETIADKDAEIEQKDETIAELEGELSEAINPITSMLNILVKSGFTQPYCRGCIKNKNVSGTGYMSGVSYDMRTGTQSDLENSFYVLKKANRDLTYVIFRSYQNFTVTPASNLPQGVTITKAGSAGVGWSVELSVPANTDMASAPLTICTVTPQ